MHRYHLLERYLLLFLITGRSLLLLVLLCIGCWKCTIYCQSAKNDFRFTLRWYSIFHCYCSSFDFICFDLLFSIFAYQEPLFFFFCKEKKKEISNHFQFQFESSITQRTNERKISIHSVQFRDSLSRSFLSLSFLTVVKVCSNQRNSRTKIQNKLSLPNSERIGKQLFYVRFQRKVDSRCAFRWRYTSLRREADAGVSNHAEAERISQVSSTSESRTDQ